MNIKENTDLNIKEIRVKYVRNKWICDLVVDDKINYQEGLNIKTKVLAFDLGLSKLATGIDNKGNQITIDRDLNSAINIMKRWFENQFAHMNEPLDISNVLRKYNLSEETHKSLVSIFSF